MASITMEMARDLGLIPSPLDYAYKAVEGHSILSKGTDILMESAWRRRDEEIKRQYGIGGDLMVEIPEDKIHAAVEKFMRRKP